MQRIKDEWDWRFEIWLNFRVFAYLLKGQWDFSTSYMLWSLPSGVVSGMKIWNLFPSNKYVIEKENECDIKFLRWGVMNLRISSDFTGTVDT